jgi:hypothetical protein
MNEIISKMNTICIKHNNSNDEIDMMCKKIDSIYIEDTKPHLYDLLIEDFIFLANLYIHDNYNDYTLSLDPQYESSLTNENIYELSEYLKKNDYIHAERILTVIILEKCTNIIIDYDILKYMIKNYIEHLIIH